MTLKKSPCVGIFCRVRRNFCDVASQRSFCTVTSVRFLVTLGMTQVLSSRAECQRSEGSGSSGARWFVAGRMVRKWIFVVLLRKEILHCILTRSFTAFRMTRRRGALRMTTRSRSEWQKKYSLRTNIFLQYIFSLLLKILQIFAISERIW